MPTGSGFKHLEAGGRNQYYCMGGTDRCTGRTAIHLPQSSTSSSTIWDPASLGGVWTPPALISLISWEPWNPLKHTTTLQCVTLRHHWRSRSGRRHWTAGLTATGAEQCMGRACAFVFPDQRQWAQSQMYSVYLWASKRKMAISTPCS